MSEELCKYLASFDLNKEIFLIEGNDTNNCDSDHFDCHCDYRSMSILLFFMWDFVLFGIKRG